MRATAVIKAGSKTVDFPVDVGGIQVRAHTCPQGKRRMEPASTGLRSQLLARLANSWPTLESSYLPCLQHAGSAPPPARSSRR